MDDAKRAAPRGALDRFWVVTNPSPVSELTDILFETDALGFILQVRGGLSEDRRPRLHVDRAAAEADAAARLAVVRGLSAIATAKVPGDVARAELLRLLDAEGNVVFETELRG